VVISKYQYVVAARCEMTCLSENVQKRLRGSAYAEAGEISDSLSSHLVLPVVDPDLLLAQTVYAHLDKITVCVMNFSAYLLYANNRLPKWLHSPSDSVTTHLLRIFYAFSPPRLYNSVIPNARRTALTLGRFTATMKMNLLEGKYLLPDQLSATKDTVARLQYV